MADMRNTDELINAVPLFLCQVRFGRDGGTAIDLNVSDVLSAYEALGEIFDEIIENISDVLVNDCIFLCGGLNLIFGEDRLEGTVFAIEHLLLADNSCYADFDEEYYNMLIADITEEQKIKLDFLVDLFMQNSQSTHDMVSDLLEKLTDYMNKYEDGDQLN